jgi:hypothetical protein
MQRALERSNPHRRHIAELTNNINIDYINRLRNKEPIHFGGLKKELIEKYEGGGMVKLTNYQGDVINAFSNKNNMPKPDMHFGPDTLAVGKSIRFNAALPKAVSSEYQAVKDMGNTGLIDDYERIKDMKMDDLNKYLKNKRGAEIRASLDKHKGIQNKRIQRRVKTIEANEPENENIDYGLSGLYGSGLKKKKRISKKKK